MNSKKTKLSFIGFGVNRCATTWIYRCLREHPQVCVSSPKETHFFSKNYHKGMGYLDSCFKSCSSKQIKGEYSPEYITHPSAPIRIRELLPDIKLIACLREPIERIKSSFKLDQRRGKLNHKTLEEKIEKNPGLYIEKGKYYTYLKKWFDLFPRKNILIVIYEDIEKDSIAFIQKIYNFLEVNDSFIPQKTIDKKAMQSARISVKSPTVNRFLFNTRRFFKKNEFLAKSIPFIKSMGLNHLVKFMFQVNKQEHTNQRIKKYNIEIDKKTKNHLQKIYQEEIIKLEKLINRDLSFWKTKWKKI